MAPRDVAPRFVPIDMRRPSPPGRGRTEMGGAVVNAPRARPCHGEPVGFPHPIVDAT